MAYTNLMNQLQGQQQKQNIFAADPQAAQQAQGQAQQVSQPEAKTTTQGQVQGGGGAEAQSDKPGDSPDSAAAGAVQQNIGRATAPQQGISRLAGSIAQQRQAQQQAADAFVQGAQAQQVGQSEIDRAIAGDQAASQQLTQLLSGQRQQAGEFRAPTVDTARARRFFDDTGRLSTSGLARQFREQGGQQYTGAQAAFDAALARRNRDVQRSAFQLGQQLEEADAAGAEVQRSAQERAQAQIDAQRQQQQEEARKYLAGQRADIQATAQQQAQAANLAAQQGPDLQAAALERFIAENPGMAEDIRAGAGRIQDVDPYMVAGQDITEQYTPEQAARFNRILALLGEGGQGAVAGETLF